MQVHENTQPYTNANEEVSDEQDDGLNRDSRVSDVCEHRFFCQ
jgi:hypothetical protein